MLNLCSNLPRSFLDQCHHLSSISQPPLPSIAKVYASDFTSFFTQYLSTSRSTTRLVSPEVTQSSVLFIVHLDLFDDASRHQIPAAYRSLTKGLISNQTYVSFAFEGFCTPHRAYQSLLYFHFSSMTHLQSQW